MVSKVSETFRALDKAVDEHVKNTNDDGVFVTGWLIVASLSSPSHDMGASDGYITYTSDGMPHHSQIGLLNIALDDRRNVSMLSTISVAMGLLDDENIEIEWDEEEDE
jgi:hypothetical protein